MGALLYVGEKEVSGRTAQVMVREASRHDTMLVLVTDFFLQILVDIVNCFSVNDDAFLTHFHTPFAK